MREISLSKVTEIVAELCVSANKNLSGDLCEAICFACKNEQDPLANQILCDISKNITAAKQLDIPICQDTGMAVVFVEVGQQVHFTDGDFEDAINQGVRQGYEQGLLRKSIVSDPLVRQNTNDNTPAVIHTKIVSGDKVRITVAPKGFGSENMSQIRMLTPSATEQDIVDTVAEIVREAGANPCPPMVIGVGIGGDFEYCAYLSKLALCRENVRHPEQMYSRLEQKMLDKINSLGIGPQGFGGNTTALYVNIEKAATHIAGLPLAVNIGCHVTRHATKEI